MYTRVGYRDRAGRLKVYLPTQSLPWILLKYITFSTQEYPYADPEVRHSNTEESVLYFIRRKHNIF